MSAEREALAAGVLALRAQGLTYREIGEALGISRTYASDLAYDPTGEAVSDRRNRMRGCCIDCGASTAWRTATRPAERCRDCDADWRHKQAAARNPCGTLGAYGRGCRCDDCRDANMNYARAQRQRLRDAAGKPPLRQYANAGQPRIPRGEA